MDPLTGILLIALVIALTLLIRDEDDEDDEETEALLPHDSRELRVASHVAALGGDTDSRAEAERSLLSLGTPVIPLLLSHLERAESDTLGAVQQLTLERLISDFGPQAALTMRRFLQRVHRASPVFPAMLRILEDINPHLLSQLARSGDIPFSLLAPLLARLDDPAQALVEARAGDAGLELILTAALPHITPDTLALLQRDNPDVAALITELLTRWALPEWLEPLSAIPDAQVPEWPPEAASEALCPPADAPLHADDVPILIAALDEGGEPHPRDLMRLATCLHDPRVQERFIRLAQANKATSSVAFRELARAQVQGLQPILNHLLRAPALDPDELLHLKAAVSFWPEPCVQALALALRSETPRVVQRASRVLTTQPIQSHLHDFLKALGRHRYSPLEIALATPLLARWGTISDDIHAAVTHDDREVQIAAIELTGFYGDATQATTLLEAWGQREYLDEVLLNALEIIGTDTIPALERALQPHAKHDALLLERRLEILRQLRSLEEATPSHAL